MKLCSILLLDCPSLADPTYSSKAPEKVANGAPRKLLKFLPVQVWPGQRLATSPAPNPTSGEVTNQMKLGGGRYRAATKVKGLSPEILIVSVVDTVVRVAGRTPLTALARLGEPDGV